jgi:hypothetical protein
MMECRTISSNNNDGGAGESAKTNNNRGGGSALSAKNEGDIEQGGGGMIGEDSMLENRNEEVNNDGNEMNDTEEKTVKNIIIRVMIINLINNRKIPVIKMTKVVEEKRITMITRTKMSLRRIIWGETTNKTEELMQRETTRRMIMTMMMIIMQQWMMKMMRKRRKDHRLKKKKRTKMNFTKATIVTMPQQHWRPGHLMRLMR